MQIKLIISPLDEKSVAFLLRVSRVFSVSQLVLIYFNEYPCKVTRQSVALQSQRWTVAVSGKNASWGSLVPPSASTAPLCGWNEVLLSICKHQVTCWMFWGVWPALWCLFQKCMDLLWVSCHMRKFCPENLNAQGSWSGTNCLRSGNLN